MKDILGTILKLKILAGALALSVLSPVVFANDQWRFSGEIYGAFANIDGYAEADNKPIPISLSTKTLLQHLHAASMYHFEAFNKSGWGIGTDYGYMDVRQSNSDMSIPVPGFRHASGKASVRQAIFEGFGFKRFALGSGSIDYLMGGRYWDNNIVGDLNDTTTRMDESWTDVFAGFRVNQPITQSIDFIARADIGGFGLTSQSTYNAYVGAEWLATKHLSFNVIYKSLWVNHEDDSAYIDTNLGRGGDKQIPTTFVYDTRTYGVNLGVTYSF